MTLITCFLLSPPTGHQKATRHNLKTLQNSTTKENITSSYAMKKRNTSKHTSCHRTSHLDWKKEEKKSVQV